MTDLLQQVGLLQTRLKHCKTSAAALRGCGRMQRTLDGMWEEGVLGGSEARIGVLLKVRVDCRLWAAQVGGVVELRCLETRPGLFTRRVRRDMTRQAPARVFCWWNRRNSPPHSSPQHLPLTILLELVDSGRISTHGAEASVRSSHPGKAAHLSRKPSLACAQHCGLRHNLL